MNPVKVASYHGQSEQINGFYLINLKLDNPPPTEFFIGHNYCLAEQPEIELTLFQVPQSASGSYQFLSKAGLAEESLGQHPTLAPIHHAESQQGFVFPEANRPSVILAEEKYMANAFIIAKQRHLQNQAATVVFLEGEAFPFMIKPARFWAPEMPDEAIGASALLEDWGIINRMASKNLLPGCFHGSVLELFAEWCLNQPEQFDWQLSILADDKEKYLQARR